MWYRGLPLPLQVQLLHPVHSLFFFFFFLFNFVFYYLFLSYIYLFLSFFFFIIFFYFLFFLFLFIFFLSPHCSSDPQITHQKKNPVSPSCTSTWAAGGKYWLGTPDAASQGENCCADPCRDLQICSELELLALDLEFGLSGVDFPP